MKKLSTEERLAIVNNGGLVSEAGNHGNWIGIQIRKGTKIGKVVNDMNGHYRELTVKFVDNSREVIRLNNMGTSSSSVRKYEWFEKQSKEWYRFEQ